MRTDTRREEADQNLVTNIQTIPEQIRLIDTREGVPEEKRSYVTTRVALKELVDQTGLDVYLISPDAKPPVYKLLDYGKFRYEQQKKLREQHKKQRESVRTMKEIYFSPSIGEHDIETKVRQISDLIAEHDIKIGIRLTRHNKFLLTSRWKVPMQVVAQDADFVLNRIIASLAGNVAPSRIQVSEGQAYAVLRKPGK